MSQASQVWLAKTMYSKESTYPRLASQGYGLLRVYLAKTG